MRECGNSLVASLVSYFCVLFDVSILFEASLMPAGTAGTSSTSLYEASVLNVVSLRLDVVNCRIVRQFPITQQASGDAPDHTSIFEGPTLRPDAGTRHEAQDCIFIDRLHGRCTACSSPWISIVSTRKMQTSNKQCASKTCSRELHMQHPTANFGLWSMS